MARLRREDRERLILAGAVTFFSERGFSGQTRELARELGITQPLLYRYFPSKKALIDRVYEELFLRRWNPAWETLLADRRHPLPDRIRHFYRAFCTDIFSREWVRMFVYAGLNGVAYNRQVLSDIERKILRRICVELRVHEGREPETPERVTPLELEYAWELHGTAFYYHLRKYVYGLPVSPDVDGLVDTMVATYLAGAAAMLDRALGERKGKSSESKKGR